MVIDDDKSLRASSRILAKEGYEVETAETGEEALEKVNKRSYDLALIDFRLPDTEGTGLLSKAND